MSNLSDNNKKNQNQSLGRREFLRSIFGISSLLDSIPEAETKSKFNNVEQFFWTDLETGQIGFPCGHSIPQAMPGSIMKLITATCLVEALHYPLDKTYECRGSLQLRDGLFKCQKAHGILDLTHAIGYSCNIYFAQAISQLSLTLLLDYASKFGLDKPVAHFSGGTFPSKNKNKFLVDQNANTATYALGLSPDICPDALQLMRIAALIAKDGKIPYLYSAERAEQTKAAFNIDISSSALQVLKQGMRIASREGTGAKLDQSDKLQLAIKTGTTPYGKKFQSWICGFFPYDKPRYAFVLRSPSGTSQDSAVPAAKRFLFAQEWP